MVYSGEELPGIVAKGPLHLGAGVRMVVICGPRP